MDFHDSVDLHDLLWISLSLLLEMCLFLYYSFLLQLLYTQVFLFGGISCLELIFLRLKSRFEKIGIHIHRFHIHRFTYLKIGSGHPSTCTLEHTQLPLTSGRASELSRGWWCPSPNSTKLRLSSEAKNMSLLVSQRNWKCYFSFSL